MRGQRGKETMTTTKTLNQIHDEWSSVNQELKERAETAYNIDIPTIMDEMVEQIKQSYKIHYVDSDTLQIKVDRRKNISVIEKDIRSIVEGIVESEKIANFIFKYRLLDGMIVIERRR